MQISVSLNKVMQEQDHAFMNCLGLCHTSMAMLSRGLRDHRAHRALLSVPLQKKFSDSCLRAVIPSHLGELFTHAFILSANTE